MGDAAASFVPPAAIRALRDYTRARTRLVRERTRCKQRLEKLLEDAQLTELPGQIAVSGGRAAGGRLRSLPMINGGDGPRDLSSLVVPRCGALEATGDPFEPYRLVDADGVIVAPVAAYLGDLQACGRPAATQRSYAMDLLRWFRFLRAVGVGWDQATRAEARDFCCWIQLAPGKPRRVRGRRARGMRRRRWRTARRCCAVFTSFTWRLAPGRW